MCSYFNNCSHVALEFDVLLFVVLQNQVVTNVADRAELMKRLEKVETQVIFLTMQFI